jgi:hypothetical protein
MVTRSPHRICVKLGDRFDPFQQVALAIQVKTGDLLRHPSSRRPRAGVGHYETQLAQTSCAPPLPHHLHHFQQVPTPRAARTTTPSRS